MLAEHSMLPAACAKQPVCMRCCLKGCTEESQGKREAVCAAPA